MLNDKFVYLALAIGHLSFYPCLCLCLGVEHITNNTPRRLTCLQFLHIFRTDASTFIIVIRDR